MRNFFSFLLLVAFLPLPAQKNVNLSIPFSGTIATYKIEGVLQFNNNNGELMGTYWYTSQTGADKKIDLWGWKKGEVIQMREYVTQRKNGKVEFPVTGYFSLSKEKNRTLKGIWNKPDFKEPLEVNICSELKTHHEDFIFKSFTRNSGDTTFITAVEIWNESQNKLIQKIKLNHQVARDNTQCSLEDVNFDGYPDLLISWNYIHVPKANWGDYYYLYEPTTSQFVYNKPLNELFRPNFSWWPQTITTSTADGRGNESSTVYKLFSGIPLMIYFEEQFEIDPKIYCREYEIVNGRSVLKKEYSK